MYCMDYYLFLFLSFFYICREFVISCLLHLEHLDDTVVTREEREAAQKVYGRRRPSSVVVEELEPSTSVVRSGRGSWGNGGCFSVLFYL